MVSQVKDMYFVSCVTVHYPLKYKLRRYLDILVSARAHLKIFRRLKECQSVKN